MNRDNHYEAAFEAYSAARAVGVHRGRRSAAQPGAGRLAQEPRLHRLAARRAGVAGRCEGPAVSLRRRAPAVLEELVDARRPAEPRRLAAALRRRLLRRCWCSPITWWAAGRRCRAEQLFEFRGAHYGFVAVRLADFVPHARPLSDSWDTVAMPIGEFRRAARSLDELLQTPAATAAAPALVGH